MSRSHLTGHIRGGAAGDVGTKRRQSSAAPSNLATVCLLLSLPSLSLSPLQNFSNSVAGRGAFSETEKGGKGTERDGERKGNEAGYFRWERDREETEAEGEGGGECRVKLQMQRNRSPPTT